MFLILGLVLGLILVFLLWDQILYVLALFIRHDAAKNFVLYYQIQKHYNEEIKILPHKKQKRMKIHLDYVLQALIGLHGKRLNQICGWWNNKKSLEQVKARFDKMDE